MNISLYKNFPRSNRKYLPENTTIKSLVSYGTNLSSTVNYPYITDIIRYMTDIPKNLEPLLVGIIISDGWLQRNKKNKSDLTRLGFKQSINKIEYFYLVYNKLSHYCSSQPNLAFSILKAKKHTGIYFVTRNYPILTEWHKTFYEDRKKIVPLNIYDLLTYEALAHWICCDGTAAGNALILETQSFSIEENVKLISILIYKFNLKCTLHFQRKSPVIYISSKSVKKLIPKIIKYIPVSLQYKLAFINKIKNKNIAKRGGKLEEKP